MQMHEQMMIVDGQEQPISRTYQYRKVMKPMLERKRRARINRCLDELKDLMVTALAGDGENVAKLEKADILELTVRHLHKLQRQQRLSANPVIDADRFRAGYTHCANEVSRCLAATPGVDVALGTKLMTHLGHKLNAMDKTGPLTIHVTAPQTSPSTRSEVSSRSSSVSSSASSTASDDYAMPLTPASSQPSPIRNELETTNVHQQSSSPHHHHQGLLQVATLNKSVWRPW